MSVKVEIDNLVDNIKKAHKANKFPDYIESIRFPYYKSLSPEAKISFDFPLTVLIGINGSGKSSALHGIYGCPDRSSTGDFWFSTPLDPIRADRRKGDIPSIIYTYKIDGKPSEVIKRRSGVAKGLDYWETSRPITMYGMKALEDGKRNPPIKKKVTFLDFRSELSAFDKFFHFGEYKTRKTINSKQDYLRRYSEYVRRALINPETIKVYNKSNKKTLSYGSESIQILSEILGKPYSHCHIVIHNFYGSDGATVMFNYKNKRYSEAFAGRGEFAVAKLIYEIAIAKEGALIILDEPEVSLHPSAQERLKLFLLKSCLKKKLQIVLSTHSPKLIEFLPDDAIKLFYEEDNGKFNILNRCSYFEAFAKIGETINTADKKIIIVEDSIAKEIMDGIINGLGRDYSLIFQVVFYPGGAEAMYKASVSYSQENESNKFLILDGDKRKPQYDTGAFALDKSSDLTFLQDKLKLATDSDFKKLGFRIDGNNGGNQEQKAEVILNYLKYNYYHIGYLPLKTPEEVIWDEEYANKLLAADDNEMPINIVDYKEKFAEFSERFYNSSSSETINTSQTKFIQNFVKKKNNDYNDILDILNKFKNHDYAKK